MAIEFEVFALSYEAALSIEYFLSWYVDGIFVEPVPSGECCFPCFPLSESLEVSNPLLSVLLEVDNIARLKDSIFSCESDEPAALVSG